MAGEKIYMLNALWFKKDGGAEKYAEYIEAVPATIAAYGGKYLVRGGATEKLEGAWEPRRMVVLEFESLERARQWWDSDVYRGPKALRRSASVGNVILAEGV